MSPDGAVFTRQALAVLAEQLPCVMFVDLMMPVMDGYTLRVEQRQIPSWIVEFAVGCQCE